MADDRMDFNGVAPHIGDRGSGLLTRHYEEQNSHQKAERRTFRRVVHRWMLATCASGFKETPSHGPTERCPIGRCPSLESVLDPY